MGEQLPRVQKGDPITADAWNQVVDAINGSPCVSITRGKRRAKKSEELPYYYAGDGISITGTGARNYSVSNTGVLSLSLSNNTQGSLSGAVKCDYRYFTISNGALSLYDSLFHEHSVQAQTSNGELHLIVI